MMSSKERITSLLAYLKAVFWEGMFHRTLTIVDVLAFTGVLFPNWIADGASTLGWDMTAPLTRSASLIVLALSFFIATFQVSFGIFERHRKTRVDIYPAKCTAMSPSGFFEVTKNGFEIRDKIYIKFSFDLEVTTHNPTHLRFSIASIESEWRPSVNCGEIELNPLSHGGVGTMPSGKLITLADSGVRQLSFKFATYFDVPTDPKAGFEYLGSLSKMHVILNVEQKDHRVFTSPLNFKVGNIHNAIQDTFVRSFRRLFNEGGNDEALDRVLVALRIYWRAWLCSEATKGDTP